MRTNDLAGLCQWLGRDLGFVFATLVARGQVRRLVAALTCSIRTRDSPWIYVELRLGAAYPTAIPSLRPCAWAFVDWHEREAEDLFGLTFEGHPQARRVHFARGLAGGRQSDASRASMRAAARSIESSDPRWEPPTIVTRLGRSPCRLARCFPILPSRHIFCWRRWGRMLSAPLRDFFTSIGASRNRRGTDARPGLLLAERFSGTAAFAHGLAFCQAVEAICGSQGAGARLRSSTVLPNSSGYVTTRP